MLTSSTRPGPLGDLDLILAAYERWGDASPERLIGDFAFAITDRRRHRVFCARDPFGVKPFYFHHSDAGFVCATELEEVLREPYVSRGLDQFGVADRLMAFYRDAARTVYRDVRRLPPAHTLVVDAAGARTRRYWTPDAVTELRLSSDAEYDEAFREVFGRAVGDRLLGGDGPVGSGLSGGLDSSSVTAMCRRLLGEGPLDTFTAVFDATPRSDERQYARAVAAHVGAIAHECPADDFTPLADWEGAPWRGSQPDTNPQIGLTRAYQAGAQRAGMRVLLTGFGGDEVVSHGFQYLTELAASLRLPALLSEARAFSARRGARLSGILRNALTPLAPRAVKSAVRRMRGQEPIWTLENPVHPDLVRRLDLRGRVADLLRDGHQRTHREAQALTFMAGSTPTAMESLWRTAMLSGVERRYPFYDRRLAEFCLSLPADQRLHDGWTRMIMRRAMGGLLPENVRWRPDKADLSHAFNAGLQKDRALLDEVVAGPGAIAEWVDPRYLTELHQRCLTRGDKNDWFTMWRVAVVALWLREHQ